MNGVARKGKTPVQLLHSPPTKLTPNKNNFLMQLLMAYKYIPTKSAIINSDHPVSIEQKSN